MKRDRSREGLLAEAEKRDRQSAVDAVAALSAKPGHAAARWQNAEHHAAEAERLRRLADGKAENA